MAIGLDPLYQGFQVPICGLSSRKDLGFRHAYLAIQNFSPSTKLQKRRCPLRSTNLCLHKAPVTLSASQPQRLLNPFRTHLAEMRNPGRKELKSPLFQHPADLPNPDRLRPHVPLRLPLIPER